MRNQLECATEVFPVNSKSATYDTLCVISAAGHAKLAPVNFAPGSNARTLDVENVPDEIV